MPAVPCTTHQSGVARMHIMHAGKSRKCILCTAIMHIMHMGNVLRPCTCILCTFCLLCIQKSVIYGARGRSEKDQYRGGSKGCRIRSGYESGFQMTVEGDWSAYNTPSPIFHHNNCGEYFPHAATESKLIIHSRRCCIVKFWKDFILQILSKTFPSILYILSMKFWSFPVCESQTFSTLVPVLDRSFHYSIHTW